MGYPIDAMCAMCDTQDQYLTESLCPSCFEAMEEMQRSANKIIESLERWPDEEQRLDSYYEEIEG